MLIIEVILAVVLIAVIGAFFYYIPLAIWFNAIVSGVPVGIFELVGMRLRRAPVRIIVESLITARKAGLKEIQISDLETHYLAGGRVPSVIKALISADKANIDLAFQQATAIDLAGRDVSEAVEISVNPKVIETPSVAAVAQDGIQLIAKALVTVRANIDQLIGGSGEETVLARVGEGIVTSIGSSVTHQEVLENPDKISRLVLSKGLDAGTAFEILSIDIADIDIGENVGAKLQTEQAAADLKVAEAKAEERRAMAVAVEQEMKAKTQNAKAKVIEAEAQVPIAIAEALREGKLTLMDYKKLENLESDTAMRKSIAEGSEQPKQLK